VEKNGSILTIVIKYRQILQNIKPLLTGYSNHGNHSDMMKLKTISIHSAAYHFGNFLRHRLLCLAATFAHILFIRTQFFACLCLNKIYGIALNSLIIKYIFL